MFELTVRSAKWFNEQTSEFVVVPETRITLEHSLISLSKWESKWKKPFLGKNASHERSEFIDYIRCMTIAKNVNPLVYYAITDADIDAVKAYIDDSMTATWFSSSHKKNSPVRERVVTSELIYYWMIAHNIPAEYQKWHLNRLLTLIEVCNAESDSGKKMSPQELARRNRELNAKRRKAKNTRG